MNERASTSDDGRAAGERSRVLLIDADAAIAAMYTDRLDLDGYSVAVAADGESGIAMALTLLPDLIYLDLTLPNGMDGFHVLKRLRGDRELAGIPVVILTNHSEPELRARALELGAREFLVKAETPPSMLAKETGDWAPLRPRALAQKTQPIRSGTPR